MAYSYMRTVIDDVKRAISENYDINDIEDIEEFEQTLNDDLWADDAVTGNGSGSYTFSRKEAEQNVKGDPASTKYIKWMCDAFGVDAAELGRRFMADDWEWFDVSIRCYILNLAIRQALEELGLV